MLCSNTVPMYVAGWSGLSWRVTGVFSKEYIPQGTRFGPLQGVVYTKDNVPKMADRKYFWRSHVPVIFAMFVGSSHAVFVISILRSNYTERQHEHRRVLQNYSNDKTGYRNGWG
ncbi:unnamed protein product [Arctogadus glacialis]